MPSAVIVRACAVERTPRVMQLEGLFDVPPSERSGEQWSVDLQLPSEWNIGVIVGPSGSGKTTIARELFGNYLVSQWDWDTQKSIVDCFPDDMSIKDITGLLSSVGFSSPPLWLRPFHVLSNGEQFRVTMARTLAEMPRLAVVDEFSSVIDRTVAQIGSAAIQKAVRRLGHQFIAVSCHYDILDWLEPDWIYESQSNQLHIGRSRRRPALHLTIQRVHHRAWEIFRRYHYLDHRFNKSARMFVAFLDNQPVAMQAVIAQPGRVKNLYRGHRAVCLPDYQGIGIGNALISYVARAYRGLGKRILSTTTNPALNAQRSKNPDWIIIGKPHIPPPVSAMSSRKTWRWSGRMVTTWEFIGEAMPTAEAEQLVYGS